MDHSDFAAIGDRLSEFGDVEVVRLSARKLDDGSSFNRSFRANDARLRPTHLDLIAESESFGASVRSLELMVGGELGLHVHLRRLAGATFYSGNFDIFEEQVLTRLENAASSRRALVSGRARSRYESTRPLSLQLPEPLLAGFDETQELLNIVNTASCITMAVVHRNPYLHFIATDERDGSNFDVMVTQADRIDIYPGFRASAVFLARFADFMGDRLGSVRLAEAAPRERISLEELVG